MMFPKSILAASGNDSQDRLPIGGFLICEGYC
jgi:hypothetical protein